MSVAEIPTADFLDEISVGGWVTGTKPDGTKYHSRVHGMRGEEVQVLIAGEHQYVHRSTLSASRRSSAPIAAAPEPAGTSGEIMLLDPATIAPFALQPRTQFDAGELAELAEDIRRRGQDTPITVRAASAEVQAATGRIWELICGERRTRACELAGVTVLAIRRDVDDETAIDIATAENAHRSNLDPIDTAANIKLLQGRGRTQDQIAALLGKSQEWVSKTAGLAALPEDVQTLVREGTLSKGHAILLTRWATAPAVVSAIAQLVIRNSTPVRSLENYGALPFAWELGQKGLTRRLDTAMFDPAAECRPCPYGARCGDTCLNPKHFDELDKAAEAARKANATAAAAPSSASPKVQERLAALLPQQQANGVLKLETLKHGSYVHLTGTLPEGCTAACPCRVDCTYYGQKAKGCLDVGRHNGLKGRQSRAESKARRERHTELITILERHIREPENAGDRFERRCIAVAAREVIRSIRQEAREAVAGRLEGDVKHLGMDATSAAARLAALFRKHAFELRAPDAWAVLADCRTEALIVLLGELLVRHELSEAREYKSDQHELTDFVLGRPATKKGGK
jgi:ParB family chromosome partitioning protein